MLAMGDCVLLTQPLKMFPNQKRYLEKVLTEQRILQKESKHINGNGILDKMGRRKGYFREGHHRLTETEYSLLQLCYEVKFK